MTPGERARLIDQDAAGPARLRAALATVPAEAMTWRPALGEWSAHEVILRMRVFNDALPVFTSI